VRREAKHVPGEETWAWRGREREISVPPNGQREGRRWRPPPDQGPLVKGSGKQDDTTSLVSPAHNSFSALGCGSPADGTTTSERRPKRPRAEVGLPTGLPSQVLPLQVISNREGEEDPFMCTSGEKVGLTPSSMIQQVLAISTAAAAASPSSLREA
jgi:hypothetical protein